MAANNADQNLLFGVLALQMEFVSQQQIVAALDAWGHAKEKNLGDVLIEQGVLDADRRQLLDAVVAQRLKQHGNDVAHSLAALVMPSDLRTQLARMADPDLQASMSRVPSAPPAQVDEYATNYGVGNVPTQPEPAKPQVAPAADPYATNIGGTVGKTQPEPPRPTDDYATNVGSVGGVGGRTRIEATGEAFSGSSTSFSSEPRYRVKRPLAKGGLGEVLIASDELDREVALKQIQSHHADDQESRARFEAEGEVTAKLEHPSIIPVYGAGHYMDGRPYYAMRFVRGDSLKEAIDKFHKFEGDASESNLQLRKLLERFLDVCQAIEYAHSRGVLHRDLKPGNVMLGKYGETLVVDWGLAKTIGEDEPIPENPDQKRLTLSGTASATPTMMGAAVGTPQFMSPEQAAGQLDKLGPPSDVYSLGATMYALLTGSVPIVDRDLITVLQRVQTGNFPKPRDIKPNIPRPLEAVCLKAMALKPEDRYPTPKFLADDIEHWLGDEPVTAYPEPLTARAARFVRRRPAIVAVAVVAMVFMGIIAVLLSIAEGRERRAKQKALENYRLARSAVDRYHTNVSEDVLLNEPGMQPLRKKLLQDAEKFYTEFVEGYRHDDPTVQGELAIAKYRLGLITADIDSEKTAIGILESAAVAMEQDATAEAAVLARCYHHLGRLCRVTDQFEASEKWYRKALTIWTGLGDGNNDHLAGWARSQFGMGSLMQRIRQYDKAVELYEAALAKLDRLVAGVQKPLEHQRDLAIVHNDLGMVYTLLGNKNEEARKVLTAAMALQEKLIKENPNISKFQNDLGASHYNLGEVDLQAGKVPVAVKDYQAAVQVFEKLTQTHPAVLDYHSRLADSYAALANALFHDKQTALAIKMSERALQAQQQVAERSRAGAEKEPPAPKYRGRLALRFVEHGNLLRRAGQPAAAATAYQDAAKIQRQLVVELPKVSDYQADLARTHFGQGHLRLEESLYKQAEAEFTEALKILEQLVKDYPESPEFADDVRNAMINLRKVTGSSNGYRLALAPLHSVIDVLASHAKINEHPALRQANFQAHWTRAEARTNHAVSVEAAQQHALFTLAIQDWDTACKLATSKQSAWVRLERCVTLARDGQSATAVKEAEELLAAAGKSPKVLFQLARVYAILANVEAKKNEKLAEDYANRAIRILDSARELGFFASSDERQRLTVEPDWQYLHGRKTFQDLFRQLQGNKS